ncbi:MAG: ACP S-malonyltransferase [Snowella sp.]|nr:ACP S-malonyltransferase [Snowella sp.]
MTTAWVFPGQGSQAIAMGNDLTELPIGQQKFSEAEQILGWSVIEKCNGNEEELSQTLYTQPCLYVVESILSDLLQEKGYKPDFVAGHSLGEYSALYAAGVFDFATGLNLVKQRAILMNSAEGGKMAALMKFDRDQLKAVVEATPNLVLANDNSEEQVVISGTPEAVDSALSQIKAKRAVPLKVSGAFHSPFMQDAAQQFKTVLEGVSFADAQVPVLSNVDPSPETAGEVLKDRLIRQMTGSVRWREIMLQFSSLAIAEAWEVGPGKVLAGLIKRTNSAIILKNISGITDL